VRCSGARDLLATSVIVTPAPVTRHLFPNPYVGTDQVRAGAEHTRASQSKTISSAVLRICCDISDNATTLEVEFVDHASQRHAHRSRHACSISTVHSGYCQLRVPANAPAKPA